MDQNNNPPSGGPTNNPEGIQPPAPTGNPTIIPNPMPASPIGGPMNTPIMPTANQTTPAENPSSGSTSPMPDTAAAPQDGPKSNKTLLLVIALFIMGAVVAVIYFMMGSLSQTNQQAVVQTTSTPTATPTSTPTPTMTPDEELNNMDLGDPTQDVNAVDQDLKQL